VAATDSYGQMTGPATDATIADPAALSRRSFLRRAAAGTAVAGTGFGSLVLAADAADAAPRLTSNDPDLHLLRRATYGPTKASLAQLRRMGRAQWLERQLKPSTIDDRACEQLIASRFPRLAWSIDKAWAVLDFGWDLMFDLGVSSVARAAWSERQLFEVMVDFWSNHLNVTNPSDDGWYCRHDYDRTVIRRHALGRFSDMLLASAQHPAMMLYLNNAESSKDDPNENYGRELLELHSVGVDAPYGEDGMWGSTLIMTGFGIDWETGRFRYWADDHHTGRVKVMGFSSRNGSGPKGRDVGRAYVRYLARHPATAHHIATKLCRRFVSDAPQPGLVQDLAATYLRHDTAIVPVLRRLFHSSAFRSSAGEKVGRPFQDQIATLRILGIGPDPQGTDGMQGLYWMIEGLGDLPLAWSQPNGYPDVADAWRSAGGTLGRWNMHMSLAAGWWPSELRHPPLDRLLPKPLPRTHGGLVDALSRRLLFRTMSRAHRDAVLGFLGVAAGTPLGPDDEAVTWRLESVVALILDSPYHQVR
jgi:uncharacterized protein (DUF1800 family)